MPGHVKLTYRNLTVHQEGHIVYSSRRNEEANLDSTHNRALHVTSSKTCKERIICLRIPNELSSHKLKILNWTEYHVLNAAKRKSSDCK